MISRRTCKPQYEVSESIILINSLNVLELIEIKFRRNLEKNLKSTTCIALASLPPWRRRQIDDWEKSSQRESVKKKDKIFSANIENQSKWNSMREREKRWRISAKIRFSSSLCLSTCLRLLFEKPWTWKRILCWNETNKSEFVCVFPTPRKKCVQHENMNFDFSGTGKFVHILNCAWLIAPDKFRIISPSWNRMHVNKKLDKIRKLFTANLVFQLSCHLPMVIFRKNS